MTNNITKALYYLILLICLILTVFLVKLLHIGNLLSVLTDILAPFFFGYIFAWILNPLYMSLRKKLDKKISIILIALGLIIIYLGIILVIIPIFTKETANFLNIIKSYVKKVQNISFLKLTSGSFELNPEMLIESCGGIISVLVTFALTHIFGFYILYHYYNVNMTIKKLFPSKYKKTMLEYIHELNVNMYQYIRGTLIDMAILFAISFILLLLFKIKYAILLAFIIAITNIIPFIGPYIGGIPTILVGFSGGTKLGVIALTIIIFSQIIESNFVSPLIMSKCVKVNPLLIIISITIMSKFFGILGMALAVPTLIILKTTYEFWENNRNNVKKLCIKS